MQEPERCEAYLVILFFYTFPFYTHLPNTNIRRDGNSSSIGIICYGSSDTQFIAIVHLHRNAKSAHVQTLGARRANTQR